MYRQHGADTVRHWSNSEGKSQLRSTAGICTEQTRTVTATREIACPILPTQPPGGHLDQGDNYVVLAARGGDRPLQTKQSAPRRFRRPIPPVPARRARRLCRPARKRIG